jgi:serine/threonine protein kinase
MQYHVLDLRAIHASFTQYLKLKGLDPQLSNRIETRLRSIDGALPEASDQGPVRVFSPIPVHYQSWRVNYSDFDELKIIGQGISATVYYGRDRRNGQEVAIKKFKFQKLNGSKLQSFQREVAALATAAHPALLKLIGATDTPPFCIITEWMPNSSLYHDLHQNHRLDATGRTIAAYDIARGMQFLHLCQIVHRDMKSLNVLLDANNRIRICDFGFSRHAAEDSQMFQNIGTPHWMAPELLSKKAAYTSKIDVYAYGIVLWELATAQTPYAGLEAAAIIAHVAMEDLRPTLPTEINPGMRDLISQCWDRNPDVRPTFEEIVRRIASTEAMFNGCNSAELLEYIRASATQGEQLARSVESLIASVANGETPLEEAVAQLCKTGVPPDLHDSCWTSIAPHADRFAPAVLAKFASLFINSSKNFEATSLLRSLPRRSIPPDVMSQFVVELPTGSPETDSNIVIAACRNGCANLCAVYTISHEHLTLALNVVARTGVEVDLRAAVGDRCIQAFGGTDAELALAALRCLLAIGDFKRIPISSLRAFVASENPPLRACACAAVAILALHGALPPADLFVQLAKNAEPGAQSPMVAGCRGDRCALGTGEAPA